MQHSLAIARAVLVIALTSPIAPRRALADDLPDIRSVAADLNVPPIVGQIAAPGLRVKQKLRDWEDSSVYHVLYLPSDWRKETEARYPVIVEWAGNGGYENDYGDTCTGRPESSNLGYGLSGGKECIWLCLPYLNAAGDDLALKWWGDAPGYDPKPTLTYLHKAIDMICQDYAGDRSRLILCGFSRGAIACNYLGLHDDETAGLWAGLFAFSHYDGLRRWPFSATDLESATTRLQRLGNRPQFICNEGTGITAIRDYLSKQASDRNIQTISTGFRNHNDAWILRPSPARGAARKWLADVLATGSY